MESTKKFFGYKASLGAFLVIFVNLGICTCLGVFLASIAEYIGWDVGTVAILGTLNTVGNIFLSLVVVQVVKKIGVRWTMLISIIACALHITLYTFTTPGQNPGSLALMYIGGLIASVAITFGSHAVCTSLVAEWFADTHGREKVTGMVVSGAGFGAAIWVFFAGQLLANFSWQDSYHIMAIVGLVIGLVAVFIFIRTPKQVGQEPKGLELARQEAKVAEGQELPGVTRKQALKTASFWLLCIGMVLAIAGASGFISYNATYWQSMGMDITESANWNAAWLILSAVIMLFVGNMFKKIGGKGFTIYVSVAFALACVFMILWGNQLQTYLVIITIIFGALGYPLCAAYPTLVTHSMFGPRDIGAIVGTSMAAVYIGQMLGPLTLTAFLPMGWTTVWAIWAIMAIIGMVILLIVVTKSPMNQLVKEKKLTQN